MYCLNTKLTIDSLKPTSPFVRVFVSVTRTEESITRTVTWVLFAFCVVVLSALLLYLYCRLDPRSYTCYTWRSQMTYYYMRLKYIYYTWNSNPNNQFG